MRKFLLLFLATTLSFSAFSQDFSNKGKDFWTAYGYHTIMTAGNSQDMVLYFATDQVTNILIDIPGIGYTQNLTSAAGNNVLTSFTIPKSFPQDARLNAEGLSDMGIHITSDRPMVAYAHIYNQSVSGATILYPTNTLGKEYYSVNFTNTSNTNNANAFFYVVATDTGITTVEITPSGNTIGGWVAGTTYTVNLNKGQVYNVMGVLTSSSNPWTGVDLTGSFIKSVNTGTGCKRIAVFSGSGRISITCNANSSSSDNYMVQALPKSTWGKKYLTVPPVGNQANNYYRVCISSPGTIVRINGAITGLPLNNGFYYQIPATNQPQLIEANEPIMVAQYFTSQGACGNGTTGDPEVIYLSAVEQNINTVLWNATPNWSIATHGFSVVVPASGTGITSFTLDGAAVSGWVTHPQDANYYYLRMNVSQGPHIIKSDSGFNAIAYGFGNAESYGYNAGTNVKDLYQQIGVSTQYGIETTPSVCTAAPFKFKVSLPYIPDSVFWDFQGAAGMSPNNTNVMVDNTGNVTEDSTTVVNGRTIHWYSLPLVYTFSAIGTYPITITTYAPDIEGCGSIQYIDFDLVVSNPPVGDFTFTGSGCVAEPVQFTETTPQIPKPTYSFWWDFDDPASGAANNSNLRNPSHLFSAPGTYTVRYASITTPGCLSDTISHDVVIQPMPDGTIDSDITVCLGASAPPITFTATGGTAPYTFIYNINGGPNQTLNTVTGNTITINAPTGVAGTFVYTLDSVKNTGSTLCTQDITGQQATVIVSPLPTATATGTITVCQNAAQPDITFTGANGVAPYTFNYTINGIGQPPVTTSVGNSVTVSVPTNVVGTFIYALTDVTEGSPQACTQPQTGTATVIVQQLPTASISGAIDVCQNAAFPNITFTGANGTAPYTFNYTINGVAQPPISTPVASNSVTVSVPTGTVGPFVYALVDVTEGSPQGCTQLQSGSVTVNVNPLPTATISGDITVCLNAAQPDITFTGANGTAPYTFNYTINGVPQAPVTTSVGNSVTVSVPTNVAGPFTYALVSVTDGSSTACSQGQTGSVLVTVSPLPTATIAGTTTVCENSAPPPDIIFTGANGTAPYTFNYTINGVPQPPVTTVAGNSITVPAPTNVPGTFIYQLTSVQEGSANACIQNGLSATSTIIVNPLPTASISASAPEVCRNGTPPTVTFTGASASAPYTFNYTINGVAQPPISTTVGNSVSIPVLTNVAGTFIYALVDVTDGSSTACSQAQTSSVTVIVNELPTADFIFSAPNCETKTITFTDASTPNSGNLAGWQWDFGDGSPLGSGTPIDHAYLLAGTYNVTLTVTTDLGCVSDPVMTRPVTVSVNPKAGFMIPEVCINDVAAVFTDTSSITVGGIDPLGYEWDFGDGSPIEYTQHGTHLYATVGLYNVTHVVTSLAGCKDTITQQIFINGANPVADYIVSNPAALCANDSVAITNISTVNPGVVTRVEIYWDNVNQPGVFEIDDVPVFNKVYKHLYPNFQAPLTRNFNIRFRAFSGTLCVDDEIKTITVNAAPLVQFNNMPNSCLMIPPFQITQASETGGVPGTAVYTGPGVTSTGIFSPQVAGPGTHTILYTYTSSAGGCVDTMSNTITVLDTASARFTYIGPICESTAGSFTDASTFPAGVTLNNTVWDFGDGSPLENHAPGSTFTHLFTGAGTFTVTMYNVSTAGCNSTVYSEQVTVDPNHTIGILSPMGSDIQTVCINSPIADIRYTLGGGATGATVSGLPTGVTYSVTGTTLTITGTPTSTVGSPFNFTVVTTGNTCITADTTGRITVEPDHTIILSSATNTDAQSVCVNTAINDITYTLGGGATNATVSGLPAGISYTVTGNTVRIFGTPTSTAGGPIFPYSITTSGNTCLQANAAGTIAVNPYPVASFTVDKPSYCIPNATVVFTSTSTISDGSQASFTYLWNFGDTGNPNNTSTAVSPSHTYTSAGPFNVSLTVKSGAGCETTVVIPLTTVHPQPRADFSFSRPGVCIGDPITFTDLSDPMDGTTTAWNWDLGDGSIRNTAIVTHLYGDTLTYPVTLYTTNSHGCNSDTLTKQFTVFAYPTVNAGPDRFILEGGAITLEPIVTGTGLQFLWTPDQFLVNNKIQRVVVMKPLTDMYYTLTVTTGGGCTATDIVFVKLLKFPAIPNTFTPNNDGINDKWLIDYLNTYPDNRVQVFTRAGQLVFESRGYDTPWDGTMKGKTLPFDTYYYIIEPGNGRLPITGYVTIIK